MKSILKIPIAIFVSAIVFGANVRGESQQKQSESVLELSGILRIGDDILVSVLLNGESMVFSGMGDSVGNLRLVDVAHDCSFVDVESNGETRRLWLRASRIIEADEAGEDRFVIDDPKKLFEFVKRKTVVVGGELSDEQLELWVKKKIELVTSDKSPLPAELRKRSLANLLTQDRILLVGGGPISAEEAARLGLSTKQVQELQVMNSMGKVLLAERKGDQPVGITIEP